MTLIGSRLVEAGSAACRKSGEDAVVVLGHPEFYPRFDPAFMALELTTGALSNWSG